MNYGFGRLSALRLPTYTPAKFTGLQTGWNSDIWIQPKYKNEVLWFQCFTDIYDHFLEICCHCFYTEVFAQIKQTRYRVSISELRRCSWWIWCRSCGARLSPSALPGHCAEPSQPAAGCSFIFTVQTWTKELRKANNHISHSVELKNRAQNGRRLESETEKRQGTMKSDKREGPWVKLTGADTV